MKICYISVFKDGTGYANQAVNNILSMEHVGLDMVARTVRFSENINDNLARRISHLEQKPTDNIDVVIQHLLPHHFEYKGGVKNIGIICWETTHFRRSNWAYCCNVMDEIWTPSIQAAQAIKDSNVTCPVKILPCACDTKRFEKQQNKLNIPQLKNKCVFYFIGELTRRKNIVAMIRSFFGSFTDRDDVVLVIKTNIPGQTPNESLDIIRKTIDDVKRSMHLYPQNKYYPKIICITDLLSDDQLDSLHVSCDVFVSASCGESWGIPAHDAMGFGNPVILSNWGSFPELTYGQADKYWESEKHIFKWSGEIDCGWVVKGRLTPCFGQTDSFDDIYTADESWFDIDSCHLIQCMQEAYVEWQNKKLHIRGQAGKKRAAEFSYEKVGQIAKGLLDE